jgi:hypothetical protein
MGHSIITIAVRRYFMVDLLLSKAPLAVQPE